MDRNVVELLRSREHDVMLVTDAIPPDSPDVSVAQLAIANDRVLITQDRDFQSQQRRAKKDEREAYQKVKLLLICDMGRETRRRVAAVVDIVEREIASAEEAQLKPHVLVYTDRVVIYR